MKALVVAPQPFFTPRGTPLSVYYRTMVTAEMGIAVDLLTYGEGADVDIPGVRIVRIPRIRAFEPIPVGPSMRKLALDVLLVLWTVALLVRRRYDVVHAHEEAVFWCRFLKPLFRFKLVYDMHSSLPQQLTNFAYTRSRLLIGAFETLENSCLRAADAVITICPELARYAHPRLPKETPHILIENSILEPVRLKDPPPAAHPQGPVPEIALPAGRPVVAYAGTLENYQGIDLLVRAFARARRERPEAFLLVVGGKPEQVARYAALAAESGLDGHVLFTGQLPQGSTRALMARAAVLTSPRTEGTNTPLKVYEQLASGIPLVATRILSHTQVLSEAVCFLAEPDPEAFGEALARALSDSAARSRVTAAALALYEKEYARIAYERKMRRLVGALA